MKKILASILIRTELKMNLWVICARIEVLAMMLIKTMMASWIICRIEVPLANMLMAAVPPKQLCTRMLKVADPIKF